MGIDRMKHYGFNKGFEKADYREMTNFQKILANIPYSIRSGGPITITDTVGVEETSALRRLQKRFRSKKQFSVAKSFARNRRRVSINTVLFAKLATKKNSHLSTQIEKRKPQAMIKEINKPVLLFIDETHDLHARTLIGLKHLIVMSQEMSSALSVVLVSHPKLTNNLSNPALDAGRAHAKFFEFGNLSSNSTSLIEWILDNCSKDKIKPHIILTKEAICLFAERLLTPLQRPRYLANAIEKGYLIGENPFNEETVKPIVSPDLNAIEPNLARHGYNFTMLSKQLYMK